MKPVIVLVEPQMGENIGAAARAMLNCGIDELRIVNPRDGWPNEKANIMSSGAFDKMPPVKVYDTTAEALADCHYTYATTARIRDMIKPVFTAKEAAVDCRAREDQGQRCAYLFGAERAGLSNEDVALSHAIITIPVNPDFSSLNLGQGVLLCAYEWFQHSAVKGLPRTATTELSKEAELPATHSELDNLYKRLEQELREGHFFRTQEMQPTVMRNLKNMFARAEMTSQEINTFHGLISALSGKKNKQ
ncbi:MAG: rRNA methyltransferase [Micavibrio aeruginosavorus]|uniref:tRNA (cytidine/uridine-2'-O-)-methyltransferase TrmJ n=1 Tax=Micavibrio aeruginosavorus TaxID=349221 RepID=A0A2W5A4C2_9BACT|nr:MAG: rRNA methyltransferase [Micavibrio aeruginosavorus]